MASAPRSGNTPERGVTDTHPFATRSVCVGIDEHTIILRKRMSTCGFLKNMTIEVDFGETQDFYKVGSWKQPKILAKKLLIFEHTDDHIENGGLFLNSGTLSMVRFMRSTVL
mmetsp:Transcript_40416/g.41063  ORF Transcript_40416/g.41063 Transcript_40416/m.41063 type:complete len:112 (+) Transcript_40416:584-919(+)